jgi:hypothetical protein
MEQNLLGENVSHPLFPKSVVPVKGENPGFSAAHVNKA